MLQNGECGYGLFKKIKEAKSLLVWFKMCFIKILSALN